MANARILAQNLSRYALTATSTNPSYPLSNLKTGFNFDLWKSASTSQSQVLNIDLGTAYAIDAVVFDAHNFEALGLSLGLGDDIYIAYSDNGSTYLEYINLDPFSTDPFFYSFLSATHRYWRIGFNKGSALSTYPEIGNFFIGKLLDFGRSYDVPYPLFGKTFNTSIGISGTGVIRTSNQFGGRATGKMSFSGDKGGLTDIVIADFQSAFNLCEGKLRPFYLLDYFNVIRCCHFDTDNDPSEKRSFNNNSLIIPITEQQAT